MKSGHLQSVATALSALALVSCAPSPQTAAAAELPAGLPPVTRAWTTADYPQAAEVLTALPTQRLPRSTSGGDGALLIDRLTSPDALVLCSDRTRPVSNRIQQCLPVGDAANAILRHYTVAMLQDGTLADDLLRIQGFLIRYVEVTTPLAREFMATIPVDDPSYATRLAGIEQMRRGYGQMILGGAVSLQAPNTFSEEVRAAFAAQLAHAFDTLEPDLPTDIRNQVRSSFAHIASRDGNADVRARLSDALRAD